MTDINQQKCDCTDCVCIVTVENAIKAGDAVYCSEACSKGHADGQGCCDGCTCSGETAH